MKITRNMRGEDEDKEGRYGVAPEDPVFIFDLAQGEGEGLHASSDPSGAASRMKRSSKGGAGYGEFFQLDALCRSPGGEPVEGLGGSIGDKEVVSVGLQSSGVEVPGDIVRRIFGKLVADGGTSRVAEKVVGCAFHDDLALDHDGDAVGEVLGLRPCSGS